MHRHVLFDIQLLSVYCLYHTKTIDLEEFLTTSITFLICQLVKFGLPQMIILEVK